MIFAKKTDDFLQKKTDDFCKKMGLVFWMDIQLFGFFPTTDRRFGTLRFPQFFRGIFWGDFQKIISGRYWGNIFWGRIRAYFLGDFCSIVLGENLRDSFRGIL